MIYFYPFTATFKWARGASRDASTIPTEGHGGQIGRTNSAEK